MMCFNRERSMSCGATIDKLAFWPFKQWDILKGLFTSFVTTKVSFCISHEKWKKIDLSQKCKHQSISN